MTREELCACVEAAAGRLPFVRQVHIGDGVRLAFEDGRELVTLLLPDHGLVRIYGDCVARVDETHEETECGDEDEFFVAAEDEGEFVELRTDDDGQWSIYCAEDEAAFTLLLDLPEAGFDQARCDELLERFIGELAFWTEIFDKFARPSPQRARHSKDGYRLAALI
ncbi:hypothetical protein [Variovorax sp. PBS-H4]|uniref:hypothetical protein n=1 Tax=Variovorax sp. PBS-H4 TaxID=434008 RepID=UPI0013A58B31|nr:hypothetical protein [Variovorax sp. PBS-H4]